MSDFPGKERQERSRDGTRWGYGNGYECKEGASLRRDDGTADTPGRCRVGVVRVSAWPEVIGGRSKGLMKLVPMLYVKGMSQRDMETVLIEALGEEPTGRSVLNEVCRS